LLAPVPNTVDLSKLDLLDAPLLADISRLSNIQQCNSIHRYPTDYNDFEENEKLRKRQKEVDEDIAKVCFSIAISYCIYLYYCNSETNIV